MKSFQCFKILILAGNPLHMVFDGVRRQDASNTEWKQEQQKGKGFSSVPLVYFPNGSQSDFLKHKSRPCHPSIQNQGL